MFTNLCSLVIIAVGTHPRHPQKAQQHRSAPIYTQGVFNMATFRMNTTADVRRTLQKVSEMVANKEIEPKQANCIIYACQTALTVINTEQKIIDNEARRKNPFYMLFGDEETADKVIKSMA